MSNPTYRYRVTDDGSVYRGQIMSASHDELWSYYWDGDQMIAFIVDWYYGNRHVNLVTRGNDVTDVGQRVIDAFERNGSAVLDRMAKVITGEPDSRFVLVNLDRGQDMYVLCWGDDADNALRDEVEAIYNGEVYRIEEDKWVGGACVWREYDYTGDEHYGMRNAEAAFESEFPLAEFPAEMFVGSDQ